MHIIMKVKAYRNFGLLSIDKWAVKCGIGMKHKVTTLGLWRVRGRERGGGREAERGGEGERGGDERETERGREGGETLENGE